MPVEKNEKTKEKKETVAKKNFQTKCFHCKEKEKITTEQGITFDLPWARVEIKKDSKMIKEFKELLKEAKGKYVDERVIKRGLINGCPKCGHTINVCCKDYIDFYTTKSKVEKENVEKK